MRMIFVASFFLFLGQLTARESVTNRSAVDLENTTQGAPGRLVQPVLFRPPRLVRSYAERGTTPYIAGPRVAAPLAGLALPYSSTVRGTRGLSRAAPQDRFLTRAQSKEPTVPSQLASIFQKLLFKRIDSTHVEVQDLDVNDLQAVVRLSVEEFGSNRTAIGKLTLSLDYALVFLPQLMFPRLLGQYLRGAKDQKTGELLAYVDLSLQPDDGTLEALTPLPTTEFQRRLTFKSLSPYLCNLLVARTARKKGYGTRLVQECENLANTLGYNTIHLHCKSTGPGLRIYRKRGYRCVKRIKDGAPVGLHGEPLLFMKKTIKSRPFFAAPSSPNDLRRCLLPAAALFLLCLVMSSSWNFSSRRTATISSTGAFLVTHCSDRQPFGALRTNPYTDRERLCNFK